MPNLEFENRYSSFIVAGVDEAGRGPLAGPVVAGAVILDQQNIIPGINDSKQVPAKKREILYDAITSSCIWAVGIVDAAEIDEINILEATKKACMLAVEGLQISPQRVLVDGNMKFQDPQKYISIIKGDMVCLSIAAASIIAKVTRDRIMFKLDKDFPEYSWRDNVGYGTKVHIDAIRNHGKSIHHRQSFKVSL